MASSCKQEFPKYFLNFLSHFSLWPNCPIFSKSYMNQPEVSPRSWLQIDCLLKEEVLSSFGGNSMQISTRIFTMVTSCTLLFQNIWFSCISRLWAKKQNPRRPYRIDANDHETMQSNNRGCINYFVPQMHASPLHNIAPLGNIVNDDDRSTTRTV